MLEIQAVQGQFMGEAPLVNGFQQTWAEGSMYLYRTSNHAVGKLVEFHSPFLLASLLCRTSQTGSMGHPRPFFVFSDFRENPLWGITGKELLHFD